jgi:hypothetical protein
MIRRLFTMLSNLLLIVSLLPCGLAVAAMATGGFHGFAACRVEEGRERSGFWASESVRR